MEYTYWLKFAFQIVSFLIFIGAVVWIAKQLSPGFIEKSLCDSKGQPSSSREKSMMAFFIGSFLMLVSTLGLAEVQFDLIALSWGYGIGEHIRTNFAENKKLKIENNKQKQ